MLNGIALGTFDGLHQGHRAVIDALKTNKKIVATFKKPPKAYNSSKAGLLMTPEDKYQALFDYGIDDIYMPEFYEIRDLSPEEYLDLLVEKYNPSVISCGFNYRFGKNAAGDTKLLAAYCDKKGISFCCQPPVLYKDEAISSSKIRQMVETGDMAEASSLIFGGFGFTAEVIHGDHRGRTIGFPTINQIFPVCLAEPRHGVYAAEVLIDGHSFKAITNLGYRPTYKTPIVTAETYIPHFLGDLYGRRLRIKLLKFLRDEHKFDSLDALKSAIEGDVLSLFEE